MQQSPSMADDHSMKGMSMERMQLVELEDLDWVPRAVRDGGTDILDLWFAKLRFYRDVAENLKLLIQQAKTSNIVDLCSGGGGGTLNLLQQVGLLNTNANVTFTDKKPNEAGIARVQDLKLSGVRYLPHSIDALQIPKDLTGIRTMSGALHHFPPAAVKELLASIVKDGEALAFFDVVTPGIFRKLPFLVLLPAFVLNAFILSIVPLLMLPFIRPFRWSRIFFTYIVPLIPFLFAWDGCVSGIRSYTPEELLKMTREVTGGNQYEWKVGRGRTALYIIGWPRK